MANVVKMANVDYKGQVAIVTEAGRGSRDGWLSTHPHSLPATNVPLLSSQARILYPFCTHLS
jgi:hypothetical protein